MTLLGPGEIVTLPADWHPGGAPGTKLPPPPPWLVDAYGAWELEHLDRQAQRLASVAGRGTNDFVELIALGKPTMGTYTKAPQLAAVANNGCAHYFGNGIYVLAQGLDSALLHRVDAVGSWAPLARRATDADITVTRYFYFDLDPSRAPNTSATSKSAQRLRRWPMSSSGSSGKPWRRSSRVCQAGTALASSCP